MPLLSLRSALAAGAAALLAACGGGDDPTGPIPADLAGDWEAHAGCLRNGCSFRLTSTADPGTHIELLEFGVRLELALGSSGSFRMRVIPPNPDDPDMAIEGTARIEGGMLIVSGAAGADTVDYRLLDDLLELAFREELRIFDFDQDGSLDPARARAMLQR